MVLVSFFESCPRRAFVRFGLLPFHCKPPHQSNHPQLKPAMAVLWSKTWAGFDSLITKDLHDFVVMIQVVHLRTNHHLLTKEDKHSFVWFKVWVCHTSFIKNHGGSNNQHSARDYIWCWASVELAPLAAHATPPQMLRSRIAEQACNSTTIRIWPAKGPSTTPVKLKSVLLDSFLLPWNKGFAWGAKNKSC